MIDASNACATTIVAAVMPHRLRLRMSNVCAGNCLLNCLFNCLLAWPIYIYKTYIYM